MPDPGTPLGRPTATQKEWSRRVRNSGEEIGAREFFRAFLIELSATMPSERMEESAALELERMGVDRVSILGSGSRALAASRVPTAEVVKLTFDLDDAQAAARIVGLGLPHVALVHEARVIEPADLWQPIGVIVSEHAGWPGLGRPGDNDKLDLILLDQNQTNKVWRLWNGELRGRSRVNLARRVVEETASRLAAEKGKRFREISAGLRALMKEGVYVLDANSGNVAIGADGVLRIVDLGASVTEQTLSAQGI